MIRIASCESSLHHAVNGKVVESKTGDSGLFQINQIHKEELDRLKLNPMKLEDNVKYAKYLFDRSGVKSWYWSKDCWSK